MRKVIPIISLLFAFFMLNALLVLANTNPSQLYLESQLIEIDALDSGWYSDAGFHGPENFNYLVGECYLPQCSEVVTFRNFFVFDLSNIDGEILTASLVIENPVGGYVSNDQSETWTIFEVTTPVSALITGGSGLTDIYNDLGTGQMLGNFVVTPTSSLVQIDYDQAGIEVLNATIGDHYAVGGAITTLDAEDNREWVFGNGNEVNVRKMILNISSPLTMTINYQNGAPGSYFNVSGEGFPPNQIGNITVNSTNLATVTVNDRGTFTFTLNTADAGIGNYSVMVSVNPSATVEFTLSDESPLRVREGNYIVYDVPAGIAITDYIFLPLITR